MFTINGIKIKNPHSFDVELYTLTKSTRVATGDMVMEFVANKRKFNFSYDAIDSRELAVLIDLVWTQLATTKQCFLTLSYPYNGEQLLATVYAGSIPHKLHSAKSQVWVWKNVSFSLIEK